jgi:2-keto-3-deoxy-6-phosphogluconate aldolase
VGVVERFEGAFLTLQKQRALHGSLVFAEAGLVLGAGTVLAPKRDATGAGFSISPAKTAFWRR